MSDDLLQDAATTAYKVDPMLIMGLYRDWVMPLTKEVQVAYLLQRLGAPTVAFVGYVYAMHRRHARSTTAWHGRLFVNDEHARVAGL